MAEGESNDVRETESDGAFTFACSPCAYEKEEAEGAGYCVVCKDYLCLDCIRSHRKVKVSRDHVILHGEDMLRKGERSSALTVQYCLTHTNKQIEVYCADHDEVICENCRILKHRSCSGVDKISDVCGETVGSQSLEQVSADVETLITNVCDLRDGRKRDLSGIVVQEKACMLVVSDLCGKINTLVAELQKKMEAEVARTATKERETISEHTAGLEVCLATLEKDRKVINEMQNKGTDQHVFIAVKQCQAGLPAIKDLTRAVRQEEYKAELEFVPALPCADLTQLLDNATSLGTVCVKKVNPQAPAVEQSVTLEDSSTDKPNYSQVIKKECKDKKLVRTGEHSIRESDDKDTCGVTAAIFLPDGRCIVCDRENDKLKLLDVEFVLRSSVKPDSYPWDVAMVTANKCIVTMPKPQKLQYVTVESTLKLSRTIGVGRPCYGVVVYNPQLYIACSKGVILITDMEGNLKKTIGDDPKMFRNPYYLAVNKARDKVYVSDYGMKAIVCVTVEGELVYKYVDSELKGPEQIAVDENENLYVCARDSGTLQVLTLDGRKYSTKLSGHDGLQRPYTFCYRSRDDVLLVGMVDSDVIYAFRFC